MLMRILAVGQDRRGCSDCRTGGAGFQSYRFSHCVKPVPALGWERTERMCWERMESCCKSGVDFVFVDSGESLPLSRVRPTTLHSLRFKSLRVRE